jgi:hypothetical protein
VVPAAAFPDMVRWSIITVSLFRVRRARSRRRKSQAPGQPPRGLDQCLRQQRPPGFTGVVV